MAALSKRILERPRWPAGPRGTLYRRLFDASHDAVVLTTAEGRLVEINAAGLGLFEYPSKEEMVASSSWELFPDVGQRDQLAARLAQDGFAAGYEVRYGTRSGEARCFEGTTSVVEAGGVGERLWLTILRDITTHKARQERLARLSRHDALTGLPNRYAFEKELERAMARALRFGHRIAVLRLDAVPPEDLGEAEVEAFLVAAAERLERNIRKVDTLARLSASAFGVIKTDFKSPEDAAQLARRLMAELDAPMEVEARRIRPVSHLGISIFPPGEAHGVELVKQAEMALYRARREGPSGYRFYDRDIGREVELRLALAWDLRRALERRQLFLEYQPRVDLADRRIVGVEALVRWDHPERGILGPVQFISLADANGLADRLGTWVLETACRQVKAWQDLPHPPLSMSVNLSPAQIESPDLADTVARVLERAKLAPSSLELELSEEVLAGDVLAVGAILGRLRKVGARISVDDFGTGRSSLESLSRLPIDKLKIDPSFIARVEDDSGDRAIVSAAIALGGRLGLQVVAEGVETRAQAEFLLAEGCYEAQGYYLCRPLRSDALNRLLDTGGGYARLGPTRVAE